MYHLTQPTQIESLFALGEYLRDVREGQRLRVEEIAQKLHIRATYLKALETAVGQRTRGNNLFLDLPADGGTMKFVRAN